jgi:hypothetical protein
MFVIWNPRFKLQHLNKIFIFKKLQIFIEPNQSPWE